MTGRRISKEVRERFWRDGYAIVPLDAGDAIDRVCDDDGDLVFDGGVEHYFRNTAEALWYGRQVWRGFLRAMDSLPPSSLTSGPEGAGDEAIHGGGPTGGRG